MKVLLCLLLFLSVTVFAHSIPIWRDVVTWKSGNNTKMRNADDCNGSYESLTCYFCNVCDANYGPCDPCRGDCRFCDSCSICCPREAHTSCSTGRAKCWCS